MELIRPDWRVANGVGAFSTTRAGGVSRGAWASFNLGRACGDDSEAVAENHRRLADRLPAAPRWLRQVHGSRLIHLDDWQEDVEADAAWTDRSGQVAAVLTADCLPILLASTRAWADQGEATVVAAVHAGWRGLAAGIVEQTLVALPPPPHELVAWIGPGISQRWYEVGEEVCSAFPDLKPGCDAALQPSTDGHFLLDLKAIARTRLVAAGAAVIHDAGLCTATDSARFFSYRRDAGHTGRQASLIWIEAGFEA